MNTLALDYEVIREISPNDEMYAVDKDHGDWYWYVGKSAIESIRQCLRSANKPENEIRNILDLPCGHGRVLRHLRAVFPKAQITACDLDRDGVEFCGKTFGAGPVYSEVDPEKIPLPKGKFDLIWVGSLFTHLDEKRWHRFLEALSSFLAEGGLLVFTAHGRFVYNRMTGLEPRFDYRLPYWRNTLTLQGYESRGFGYGNYKGSDTYGISLSDPAAVCSLIRNCPALSLVSFAERAWHRVHDVYGCMRRPKVEMEFPRVGKWVYAKHRTREMMPPFMVQTGKAILGRGR